jgi:hypothetical protein
VTTKKKDHAASGSAIAGAGAVTAAGGLIAGGVPGGKSDFTSVFRVKRGEGKGFKRAASTVKGAAPAAKAAPGGIFGFRTHAHEGGLYGYADDTMKHNRNGANARESFRQGRTTGKIGPEMKIISQMKGARKVAHGALGAGVGAVAYGAHRARKTEVKKDDRHTKKYSGALLGAGGTAAVGSHVGSKVLTGQAKKWEKSAAQNVDEAGRLVPRIAGRQKEKISDKKAYKLIRQNKPHPMSSRPSVSDHYIKNNPLTMSGVHPEVARHAGRLRGAAAQEQHFADVYRNTSKVVRRLRTPSLVAAAAGAGGLAAANKKTKVKKNLSAFGVEHG